MTEELIRLMIQAGLTRQQATSRTAETLKELFMPEDGKVLIAEAKQEVINMSSMVRNLKSEYDILNKKISDLSQTLLAINEAQNNYGSVEDCKAKETVALYGALLNMNYKYCKDGSQAVKDASYIIYAYLGGQAKREITYVEQNQD